MSGSLVEQFERLLSSGTADVFAFLSKCPSTLNDKLNVLLLDQRARWRSGQQLPVEEYLARFPDVAGETFAVIELAFAEYKASSETGVTPDLNPFVARFLSVEAELRHRIQHWESELDRGVSTATMIPSAATSELLNGRYRRVRDLGAGTFGEVYLAYDLELDRHVAVKVPNATRISAFKDIDFFVEEARTAASLNHPNIVPVYDIGRTPEGAVYIVSRFIEGKTLRQLIGNVHDSLQDRVRLIAIVADALHYAHQKKLIHRDVKPDNILIEVETNTPFITDFGLAIREDDYARQLDVAGTPSYMSPEQALGEGHRLDGRSDVFSLGVVLYEIITTRRPFRDQLPQKHCIRSFRLIRLLQALWNRGFPGT